MALPHSYPICQQFFAEDTLKESHVCLTEI